VVTVHCRKCGARYETTLPAAGVQRVGRCGVCNMMALEIVDDAERAGDPASPDAAHAPPAPADADTGR
jgi:hypothetical protein